VSGSCNTARETAANCLKITAYRTSTIREYYDEAGFLHSYEVSKHQEGAQDPGWEADRLGRPEQ